MITQFICPKKAVAYLIFVGCSLNSVCQPLVADLGLLVNRQNYAPQTIALSASSLSNLISEKGTEIQLRDIKKKVDSGRYTIEDLYQYISMLKQENMPYAPIVNKHLKNTENMLSQKANVAFVWEFSSDLSTAAMDCLLEHKTAFESIYGQQTTENQILTSVWNYVDLAASQNNIRLLQRAMEVVEKSEMANTELVYYDIQKKYYDMVGDYKSTLQIRRLEKVGEKLQKNALYWQEKAWGVLMLQPSTDNIKSAIQYIERSIELDSKYENNQTYAFLLFKLGKTKHARRAAQKALQIARNNNQDATGAINLLQSLTK